MSLFIVSGHGRQARTTRSLIMFSVTSCRPADNSKNGKGGARYVGLHVFVCLCLFLFISIDQNIIIRVLPALPVWKLEV